MNTRIKKLSQGKLLIELKREMFLLHFTKKLEIEFLNGNEMFGKWQKHYIKQIVPNSQRFFQQFRLLWDNLLPIFVKLLAQPPCTVLKKIKIL